MKKKFLKLLSIIMICCISLLCVGCMGSDPNDYDESGEGGLGQLAFDMYGAKVLYRPDTYDYNGGSGAEEGETNDYYGKYAYLILQDLLNTYGISNSTSVQEYLNNIDTNNIYYLYDSIRYNIDTVGTVTQVKTIETDDSETISDIDTENQPFIISADTVNWNWSFDYNLSGIDDGRYNAFLYHPDYITNAYSTSNNYFVIFDNQSKYTTDNSQLYSDISSTYTLSYLGTSLPADYTNYSDLVKALEYVVYSYALDLEPKQVNVEINDNATSLSNLYSVSVYSYDSVDDALNDIKALFNKIGSYVGLIDRQIKKIATWVKNNVIGQEAIANDTLKIYQDVVKVEEVQEEGENIISYEFDEGNATVINNFRQYSTAVDNIVEAVCENVTIGSDDGGDVTIDQRFLASEVKEYAGNTFFIDSDINFPKPGTSASPLAIQPLEYQSVQLMLKGGLNINDVWIALKYDADLDGTQAGVYDLNKYLDIIVELNYYNHAHNKMFTIGSQATRVYDGPYKNIMQENTFGLPNDDHGTLFFSNFVSNCDDPTISNVAVGESLPVGAFNTDIGNGILKTDVGKNNYDGLPFVSKNPLVLVGTTDVRKYYSIIEPSDNELGENQTYITGRANPAMYAGNDGCDYLEITYKVLKQKGDKNTNYKFYTGIVAMFDDYEGN